MEFWSLLADMFSNSNNNRNFFSNALYTYILDFAFNSVEHIMRDVNNGWLIRYMHANGASFFFIVVYIHIFRGLYYGSYITPKEIIMVFRSNNFYY